MPDKDEKISLTFIINGQAIDVPTGIGAPLEAAASKALSESGNAGRDRSEWEARDSNGVLLDQGRTVRDLGLKSRARVFLSLRVGAGGECVARS